MSKQSANRHRKQNQGSNKTANNVASTRTTQTTKTNGTVATKQLETSTNGTTTTKPGPLVSTVKSEPKATAKPAQAGAKPGTLKRAQQRKQEKIRNRLEQQREDARSTRNTVLLITTAVVLVGALIGYFVWHNLAGTDTLTQAEQVVDANYGPVDGVYCDSGEQLAYHIHAHLSIYINGQSVPLVANTGIAPDGVTSQANVTCYYWLHTHDASGVIHIESPTTKLYALSDFFDIWQQKFSSSGSFPTQLSSSAGWTIYVNGKQVNTDFNHLMLHAHDLITLAYNSPGIKPDTTYAWQGL
jgi:hypothetical protein